jgi:hypothetical protein
MISEVLFTIFLLIVNIEIIVYKLIGGNDGFPESPKPLHQWAVGRAVCNKLIY